MSDVLPVTETQVGGKASVGPLGGELGGEEKGFPDGRACGSQEQKMESRAKEQDSHHKWHMHRHGAARKFFT